MMTSESIAQLSASLAIAQGELEDASKDKINPAFKSKYADITAVLQAARPALSKNGLAIVQGLETAPDMSAVIVTTRLCHKSGEWIQSVLAVPVPKKDAQGVGNAGTYGRRYGLAGMIGIGQEDDDGNSVAVPKTKPAAVNGNAPTASQVEAVADDLLGIHLKKLLKQIDDAPAEEDVKALAEEGRKLPHGSKERETFSVEYRAALDSFAKETAKRKSQP